MFRNSILPVLLYCRKVTLRLLLFGLFVCIACSLPLNCTDSKLKSSRQRSFEPIPIGIAKDINAFTWKYVKRLAENPVDDNGVISPQSIYHCLAMSYIASGGQTRRQLADVIGFPQSNTPLLDDMKKLCKALNANLPGDASIALANGIWLDKTYATFRPEYIRQLQEYFNAQPNEIRFANKTNAVREINSWVSRKTGGQIDDVISPDDLKSKSIPALDIINEPALVIVNAVYFYSPWASGFDKKETRKLPFKLSDSPDREVETMHQYGALGYGKYDDYAVLRLVYRNVPFSMYIVLPDKILSAREMIQWAGDHKELCNSIPRTENCNVDVLLPKFSLVSQYDMIDQLIRMGVTDAFDLTKADFDKMIIKTQKNERIYISTIRQKATMEVNEDGSKAAAATSSVSYSFACSASPSIPSVAFHADRPFLFMVVHEPSGTILFNGWVSKPDPAEQ